MATLRELLKKADNFTFVMYVLAACCAPFLAVIVYGLIDPSVHGWAMATAALSALGAVLVVAGVHLWWVRYLKTHRKPSWLSIERAMAPWHKLTSHLQRKYIPSVPGFDTVNLLDRVVKRMCRRSSLNWRKHLRMRWSLRGERRKFAAIVRQLREKDPHFACAHPKTSRDLGDGDANPGAVRNL